MASTSVYYNGDMRYGNAPSPRRARVLRAVNRERASSPADDVDPVQAGAAAMPYVEDRWLEVPLGITGWGHHPYPQFYLDVMLTCGAKSNEARFCDEEFDRLATIAGSSLDEQE